MTIKKRLFVFGCSYTAYSWPMWSDLLSLHYDEFENWGIAGLGNRAIAERVAEANVKHKFTSNDTVIVQWSTHLRHDFFHQESVPTRIPGWKTAGSVFNYLNAELYDEKWLKTFFDEEAYFMHTLNHISLTQHLLEHTGATWLMTGIGDVRELGTDIDTIKEYGENSLFTKIIEKIKGPQKHFGYRVTPSLEVYDDAIWGQYADHWVLPIWPYILSTEDNLFYEFLDESKEWFIDHHPRTSKQIGWLTNQVIPKLNLTETKILEYYKVAKVADDMYEEYKAVNTKRDFEKALFRTDWDLPNWPNMVKGYFYF